MTITSRSLVRSYKITCLFALLVQKYLLTSLPDDDNFKELGKLQTHTHTHTHTHTYTHTHTHTIDAKDEAYCANTHTHTHMHTHTQHTHTHTHTLGAKDEALLQLTSRIQMQSNVVTRALAGVDNPQARISL
jgi:hypothetical protein